MVILAVGRRYLENHVGGGQRSPYIREASPSGPRNVAEAAVATGIASDREARRLKSSIRSKKGPEMTNNH